MTNQDRITLRQIELDFNSITDQLKNCKDFSEAMILNAKSEKLFKSMKDIFLTYNI